MIVYIYPTAPEFEALRGRECEVVSATDWFSETNGTVVVRVTPHCEMTLTKSEVKHERFPACGAVPAVRRH